ncbi:MAG: hypothetical protein HC849_04060 [Oscillatoriales cyanobacterium RU_3_3]|nr:hypothetical protein [Microcoleus sp. SU_5_3]NJL68083.1 hypothetical protein [Microcoleus sp. SM1_3_4]NJM59544.1 hypothetical protein [Oscillatoriales cyanobacterium RU_3_3]NJR26683.1 hypothetical protein [Richelia sp. CSU_2_1]
MTVSPVERNWAKTTPYSLLPTPYSLSPLPDSCSKPYVGWHNRWRVYSPALHFEIENEKIWIQLNGTEFFHYARRGFFGEFDKNSSLFNNPNIQM